MEELVLNFKAISRAYNASYFNIVENIFEDLFFCYSEVRVIIIGMRAIMNDSVHIQIQVIKFWDLQ